MVKIGILNFFIICIQWQIEVHIMLVKGQLKIILNLMLNEQDELENLSPTIQQEIDPFLIET
jgi:hypothetical protein